MEVKKDMRLAALRRFAIAISALTILGHVVLGFEQSWIQVGAALATTYALSLLLEAVDARNHRRVPRFTGGIRNVIDFLLPAHIPALAIGMLLYSNDQVLPFAFAGAVAIASKVLFQVDLGRVRRHFFNPSNTGISLTLLLFPWVGIAPPYHFTENISGVWDWALPGLIILTGSFLNYRFTKRIPLILAWVSVFAAQAIVRSLVFDMPVAAALLPMTGLAFLLFTFYMISDPATTPHKPRAQIVFGAATALVYSALVVFHVVFGLFFSLLIVCGSRGLYLYWLAARQRSGASIESAVRPVSQELRP